MTTTVPTLVGVPGVKQVTGTLVGKIDGRHGPYVKVLTRSGAAKDVRVSSTGRFKATLRPGIYRVAIGNNVVTKYVRVRADGRTSLGVIRAAKQSTSLTITTRGAKIDGVDRLRWAEVEIKDSYRVPSPDQVIRAGKGTVKGLGAGRYRIEVSQYLDEDSMEDYQPLSRQYGHVARVVTVPRGARTAAGGTFTVPRPFLVRGIITSGGKPVAGIDVGSGYEYPSGRSGAYAVKVTGPTTITFQDPYGQYLTRKVKVDGTRNQTLNIALQE
jgi:hypothetical protein